MFVCEYTYLGLCTLRAHTKEYTNKRERERKRNGEKFNAILRRFSIFVRRAYLGALTGEGEPIVVER